MRVRGIVAVAALGLLLASGCKKGDQASPGSTPSTTETVAQATLSAEELGELGAKIKKSPDDAQKLLSEKGLNESSFEQAVRKVAEDPSASKRYAAAYKKAGG